MTAPALHSDCERMAFRHSPRVRMKRCSSLRDGDGRGPELIARGPDGNRNLIVTGYMLCNNYVREKNADDRWTEVWVPIVPRPEGAENLGMAPSSAVVKAVLLSHNVRSEQDMKTRLEVRRLRVLVNPFTSLTGETRELLKKEYPQTEFAKCIILQEGRAPWERPWIYLMGGVSALLILAAIGLFALAIFK